MIALTLWRSLTDAHGTRISMSWDELASRLKTPTPRPADAENPKLAGWSPATFANDKRSKAGVEHVTALGLDLDTGALPLEQVRLAFEGTSIIIHSTRRYTPEAPRWRIVVATSRAMTAAEHAIVWECERVRLASFGIALDVATKDPSRFWFLPCEPLAGDYICATLTGEPRDVEACLTTQPELPMKVGAPSEVVVERLAAYIATTDEPEALAKITLSTRRRRALAYVARAEPSVSGQDGHKVAMRVASAVVRGFALGSSGEALAVLDAWNVRCDPPWSSRELVHKVNEAMRVGALPWGKMLLADLEPEEEPESEGAAAKVRARKVPTQLWEGALLKDKKGCKRIVANVITVLSHADEWKDAIAWDEFAGRIVITRECPAGTVGPWDDVADIRTAEWMQRSRWHLDVSDDLVAKAARSVANSHRIHPVRDWLSSLAWDKVARIDTWLARYLGVDDTPYVRAVGRRFLISAVARVFRPGCQVDTMLILEGGQGLRKSSALRILASDEWFLDTGIDVRDKEASSALRQKWLVEFSELAALRGNDVERTKQFVSTRVDTYRPKYGRHFVDFPRQCVLVGSTNARQYLRDETGGRRFWPVRVQSVDIDALRADREQLWAEAVAAFVANEPWYLNTAELEGAAGEEQESRRAIDPWEETIAEYTNAAPRLRDGVVIADLMNECLKLEVSKRTRFDEMRIGAILSGMGWERGRERRASSRPYVYRLVVSRAGKASGETAKTDAISNVSPTVLTGPTNPSKDIDTNVNTGGALMGTTCPVGPGEASDEEPDNDWWERDS